jgi:prepilin-type N-terminal cleavage/methylation domain-containing protein
MKTAPVESKAFSLIELLVVIAIIAIIAAMVLPALSAIKRRAMVNRAQMQMTQIAAAIRDYESTYNRLPASAQAITNSMANGSDFTYGTFATTGIKLPSGGPATVDSPGGYHANNAEIVSILLDLESFPNGQGTLNSGHVANPQKKRFLSADMVNDGASPGIGSDGVYRDPWGNPYIITLDLNGDHKAHDAFYCRRSVSQSTPGQGRGFFGLVNSQTTPDTDEFEATTSIMVWSAGPDKIIDPATKATEGVNKDNVLSWK